MLCEYIEKPLPGCIFRGFPSSPVARTLHLPCRGLGFDPWLENEGPPSHMAAQTKKSNQGLNLAQRQLAEQRCRRETAPSAPFLACRVRASCVESLRCSVCVCCEMLCVPEAFSGTGSAQTPLWLPLLQIHPHCLEREEWICFSLTTLPWLCRLLNSLSLAITLSSWKEVIL